MRLEQRRGAGALTGAVLALVMLACAPQTQLAPQVAPSPTASPVSAPGPAPTITGAAPTRTPAQPSPTATADIVISSPTAGQTVGSPVRVNGRARVFEGSLQVAIKDGRGVTLGVATAQASAGAPEWGAFSVDVPVNGTAAGGEGLVEAFSMSPRDGAVQNLVTVRVQLAVRPAAGAPPAAATRTP